MKLKKKDIDPKTGKGYCVLIPEEPDDMWHAYHLIAKGDLVKSSTVRRIVNESATGSVSSEKVRLYLTLEISSIDFDSQSGVLRLGGKNVSESRFVKMGQFHTMQLEMNQEFTLEKEFWDSVAWDRIQLACDPTKYADAGAIVMQEGLAHVCLLTPTMTIIRAKIEVSIPRKRKGSVTSHDKGLERFFDTVMQAILRHYDFNVIKCVVIASPGFVKDQFFEYLMAEATRQGNKLLLENKGKFILAHSSTGHKHSLKDVLLDPSIAAKLADTKASGEVKALNDFYDMLKNDPDRAFYGIVHVEIANERLAIQTLLMTDELFRSADLKTRNRYVQLVESVKANGGEVKIFSTLHVSGEQLGQLGGVAAILRFPLPEIEELEEERMNQQKEAKEKEGKDEE